MRKSHCSITLRGHKTSVSVEAAFWTALKLIAIERKLRLHKLVDQIDKQRRHANLSSAIRLFVLDYYQNQRYMFSKNIFAQRAAEGQPIFQSPLKGEKR